MKARIGALVFALLLVMAVAVPVSAASRRSAGPVSSVPVTEVVYTDGGPYGLCTYTFEISKTTTYNPTTVTYTATATVVLTSDSSPVTIETWTVTTLDDIDTHIANVLAVADPICAPEELPPS